MKPRIVLAVPVILAAIAVAMVMALGSTPAEATIFKFEANIDEAQAISTCPTDPTPSSSATGQAVVVYNDVTNELSWSVTFSGLSGTGAIAAHFHGPAGPGVDAGIQVPIDDLTSPSQGSVTLSDATDPPKMKATLEAQLLSGQWYINYHTSACTGGEIRGQVVAAAVGGIAELPQVDGAMPLEAPHSSGSSVGVMAGIAAGAAAVTIAAGGAIVYARKRWQR